MNAIAERDAGRVILFVCSGNICRSPYAEGYLRHRLGDRAGFRVVSAGTLGIHGGPASPETVRLAEESGFDLRGHRSRGVTYEAVDEADRILVMEDAHRRALLVRYPEDGHKVRLLSEYHPSVGQPAAAPDIFDPIGRPLDDFRQCFRLIRDSVEGLLARGL
jgi:protein-tyrosine phosphatase